MTEPTMTLFANFARLSYELSELTTNYEPGDDDDIAALIAGCQAYTKTLNKLAQNLTVEEVRASGFVGADS